MTALLLIIRIKFAIWCSSITTEIQLFVGSGKPWIHSPLKKNFNEAIKIDMAN